ncbi:hypothetical protein CYMTET_6711 [Cymbomonas tetramitiformis]|uniref:Uncharacterized protein n=1 Tax=Cymbomonas tetramitiformis TaxID=36881 RepID=A0AAE0LI54_9CHLO|nr:hypothetical protein CYMTET_6711 [Cymbomonas tetramitiformis]
MNAKSGASASSSENKGSADASLKGGAPTTYSFNEPSFVWESSPEQTTRVRTPVVPLQILSTAALDDKVRHLETVLAKKDHELRMLHERLKYSEDRREHLRQDIEAQGEDLNTARREVLSPMNAPRLITPR